MEECEIVARGFGLCTPEEPTRALLAALLGRVLMVLVVKRTWWRAEGEQCLVVGLGPWARNVAEMGRPSPK